MESHFEKKNIFKKNNFVCSTIFYLFFIKSFLSFEKLTDHFLWNWLQPQGFICMLIVNCYNFGVTMFPSVRKKHACWNAAPPSHLAYRMLKLARHVAHQQDPRRDISTMLPAHSANCLCSQDVMETSTTFST